MARAGTRKVDVNGEALYLDKAEAELVELIRDGVKLTQQRKQLDEALERVKQHVLLLAEGQRGSGATVNLSSAAGQKAKVVWRRALEIDPERAGALKAKLGEAWARVFAEKVSYATAEGYEDFMKLSQGTRLDALKGEVGAAVRPRQLKPSVSFEDAKN